MSTKIKVTVPCSHCKGTGRDIAFLDPSKICESCISQIQSDYLKHTQIIRTQCKRGYFRGAICMQSYCIHKACFKFGTEYCSEFCSKIPR